MELEFEKKIKRNSSHGILPQPRYSKINMDSLDFAKRFYYLNNTKNFFIDEAGNVHHKKDKDKDKESSPGKPEEKGPYKQIIYRSSSNVELPMLRKNSSISNFSNMTPRKRSPDISKKNVKDIFRKHSTGNSLLINRQKAAQLNVNIFGSTPSAVLDPSLTHCHASLAAGAGVPKLKLLNHLNHNNINDNNIHYRQSLQGLKLKDLCLVQKKKKNFSNGNTLEDNAEKKYKKISSFALSQAGKTPETEKKINQDSYVLLENIFGLKDFGIYGIMDGHGTNGHLVSQFVKEKITEYFSNRSHFFSRNEKVSELKVFEKLSANNCQAIKKLYNKLSKKLSETEYDISFSGTTCVIVFRIGKRLIISNTGDSRAIIVKDNVLKTSPKKSKDPFVRYEVEALSEDHKPNNPEEKKRIERSGGVVQQCTENGKAAGPYRVWVKDETYPGIATSRTIGDSIAETVGVIHEPDIKIKELTNICKYFFVASDGVWEFLSNQEVMDIINPYFSVGDAEAACQEVIQKATEIWSKEDDARDDITGVLLFLSNFTNYKNGTV